MDAQTIAIAGLCVTIAAHGIATFFKTPKEYHTDTERRLVEVETRLTNLSMRFEGSHGKHDQALVTLTQSIDRLTARFDAYMGDRNGGRGNRGTI